MSELRRPAAVGGVLWLVAVGAGACRSQRTDGEQEQGVTGRVEALWARATGPRTFAMKPWASLAPASPGAPPVPYPSACASATVEEVSWHPLHVPAPDASSPWAQKLRLRETGTGSGLMKLCYTKGPEPCLTATEMARQGASYSPACCVVVVMTSIERGPTVERVTAPEACAGVSVCCYEGPLAIQSGPGRPLRVGGRGRWAARRGRGDWA